MGNMGNKDWWLGRTDDQRARREAAREGFKDARREFSESVGNKQGLPDRSKDHREKPSAEVLAKGQLDNGTALVIFKDGTFSTKGLGGLGPKGAPDRLLAIDIDSDSMRRKSTVGRGAAVLATGGLSLAAGNNRGVSYITVTGERTGVKTYSQKNPQNHILDDHRTLKAAADSLLKSSGQQAPQAPPPDSVIEQIKKLGELHAAGVLTDDEFAAKKKDLLDRM